MSIVKQLVDITLKKSDFCFSVKEYGHLLFVKQPYEIPIATQMYTPLKFLSVHRKVDSDTI